VNVERLPASSCTSGGLPPLRSVPRRSVHDLGPAVERLRLRDVDQDVDLAVRFGLRVPVLELDGEVLCEAVYDGPRVRQALGV